MKVAVAAMGDAVAGHFGHCKDFVIYETEHGNIIQRESVPNPGHKPGFLPNFLADRGVEVVISGGMGERAAEIFRERGVKTVTGATGDADSLVKRYLENKLKSTGSLCHEHEHTEECGR